MLRHLAIDVGGTSTRAVVVQDDGQCVGYGAAGGGNPTASGTAGASSAILVATNAALDGAGVSLADIATVVAGTAGGNGVPGARLHAELVRSGFPATTAMRSDVLATYCSGTLAADGYAVVAGTGAIAARIRSSRIDATCDGLGWVLGDNGSGYWIGRRVFRTAAAALDGRRSPTVLVDLLLARLGVGPPGERGRDGRLGALQRLVDTVADLQPIELAAFAPLAFEGAAAGDSAAEHIVAGAGDALAETFAHVATADVAGPLVLGGSLLHHQPFLAERLAATYRDAGLAAPVSTVSDGIVGAAVLALRDADVDDSVFARIRSSIAALR